MMMRIIGLIPGLIADVVLIANNVSLCSVSLPFQCRIYITRYCRYSADTRYGGSMPTCLINERCREELALGKTLKKLSKKGVWQCLSAILDGQITTLLIGIILFIFGTGSVKGFARRWLSVSLRRSLPHCSSRVCCSILYCLRNREWNISFTTNLTKNWFQGLPFRFYWKEKIGYIISPAWWW